MRARPGTSAGRARSGRARGSRRRRPRGCASPAGRVLEHGAAQRADHERGSRDRPRATPSRSGGTPRDGRRRGRARRPRRAAAGPARLQQAAGHLLHLRLAGGAVAGDRELHLVGAVVRRPARRRGPRRRARARWPARPRSRCARSPGRGCARPRAPRAAARATNASRSASSVRRAARAAARRARCARPRRPRP